MLDSVLEYIRLHYSTHYIKHDLIYVLRYIGHVYHTRTTTKVCSVNTVLNTVLHRQQRAFIGSICIALTQQVNGCVSKDVEVNIIRFIKKAFQNLKHNQLFQFDSLERMFFSLILNVDLQRILNARGLGSQHCMLRMQSTEMTLFTKGRQNA